MREDIVDIFLRAPIEERMKIALDDAQAPKLRRHLGDEAFEEYVQLARDSGGTTLGIDAPKNLVFLPGVMGSLLQSRTKGGIWWVDIRTRRHIDDLRLSPDGRTDADRDNDITPSAVDIGYEAFQSAILKLDNLGHVAFPYDWRKPLSASASTLRDLVQHLYRQNGQRPVHLVAHSMGGLTIRTALMTYGEQMWPCIGNIVFIATPHYGSPAVAGYLKNHLWGFEALAVLGLYLSRTTFRSLWGILELLPAPRGVYPGTRDEDPDPWSTTQTGGRYVHPCANFDIYDVDSWKLGLPDAESMRLQAVLDGAADFHRRLYQWHQALDQRLRDRMLVIAGVGYRTLFRLAYKKRGFGPWEHMDKVTRLIPGDPHRDGDGRVPLASAALDDVPIRYVHGVHGGLPNMPAVYHDVFSWLTESSLRLPRTPAEAHGLHLGIGDESRVPHLDGSARAEPFGDDPGILDLAEPDPARLKQLRSQVEAEEFPAFNNTRLL